MRRQLKKVRFFRPYGISLTGILSPLFSSTTEKPEVAPKPTKEELVEKDTMFEFKVGVKGKPGEKKQPEEEPEEIVEEVEEVVKEAPKEEPTGKPDTELPV